jgi:hypothetical protein
MNRFLCITTILIIPFFSFSQPNYTVSINTNPSKGNLFFQTGGQTIKPVSILDSSGTEIFWADWGLKGWDFKVNKNNKLTYFDRSSNAWFIMDSLKNVVDSVYCLNSYIADNHDFIALENGNYILFAYDQQQYAMDTVISGGDPNALVEGLIIQELDSNHNLIFQWSSWDYFNVTDNITLDLTNSSIPFIHCNSIDIDFDGHLLISSRNLDEITKIHRFSGEVIWRWGGAKNQFSLIGNDYPFSRQHCLRSLGSNRYLLFDNGNFSNLYTGTRKFSRVVEYLLDTVNMTSEKIWEFVHPDSLFSPSISSVQRLEGGNTLIDFGNLQPFNMGSVLCEVDSIGQIVFEIRFNNGQNLYRAHKFDWFFTFPGCMDSSACNFDSTANAQDSSCRNATFSYDTIIVVGSYFWNGNTLSNSGDYSILLTNSVGCDSSAFLNLNIINPTAIQEISGHTKRVVKIVDVLGRQTKAIKNKLLFYIYDDGSMEKMIFLE